MVDTSKNPFNAAANKELIIRDKDNVAPELKLRGVELPRPNLAPMGSMGIRKNLPAHPVRPKKILSVDITKGDPEKDLYIHGNITDMKGYSFTVKAYDLPSKYGIEGGKISKLDIRKGGVSVVRYDRGWDAKPQTARDLEATRKVQDAFGGKEREFKPIVPKSPDKDHGHER